MFPANSKLILQGQWSTLYFSVLFNSKKWHSRSCFSEIKETFISIIEVLPNFHCILLVIHVRASKLPVKLSFFFYQPALKGSPLLRTPLTQRGLLASKICFSVPFTRSTAVQGPSNHCRCQDEPDFSMGKRLLYFRHNNSITRGNFSGEGDLLPVNDRWAKRSSHEQCPDKKRKTGLNALFPWLDENLKCSQHWKHYNETLEGLQMSRNAHLTGSSGRAKFFKDDISLLMPSLTRDGQRSVL